MRLSHVDSIEAAHSFLPSFILKWNEKFSVKPRDAVSAHRPWTKTEAALDVALARQEERILSKALPFSYGATKYCVNPRGPGTAMRGAKVLVHHLADDRLHVTYKDRVVACTAYGTYPVPDPAEDEKTLDVRVDAIIARQRAAAGQMAAAASAGCRPGGRTPRSGHCAGSGDKQPDHRAAGVQRLDPIAGRRDLVRIPAPQIAAVVRRIDPAGARRHGDRTAERLPRVGQRGRCSDSDTSTFTPIARTPSASMAARASSSLAGRRSASTRFMPAEASALAMPRPMPPRRR